MFPFLLNNVFLLERQWNDCRNCTKMVKTWTVTEQRLIFENPGLNSRAFPDRWRFEI